MDVNKYVLFVRAVETGNLSKAAAQLNYSQTAASHMISSMEEVLGIKVLYRGRNGVSLTEEGERIYPLAKELVLKEEEIRILAGEENIHRGKIRIGVITSVAVQWMPQIIMEFGKLYPLVEIYMNDAINYEIMKDWFAKDVIDCAITVESNKKINETPLIREPYYVIVPINHTLSQYEKITPQLLKGETFVIPSEGTSYAVGKILRQAKGKIMEPNGFLSDQATIAMVRGGCGISILPKLVLDSYDDSGYTRRILEPEVNRIIYFCLSSRGSLQPTVKSFVAFVKEWIRKHVENVLLD
ncbi:MAG: LysR family transcriptional regulator [Lachnotalea sp.]